MRKGRVWGRLHPQLGVLGNQDLYLANIRAFRRLTPHIESRHEPQSSGKETVSDFKVCNLSEPKHNILGPNRYNEFNITRKAFFDIRELDITMCLQLASPYTTISSLFYWRLEDLGLAQGSDPCSQAVKYIIAKQISLTSCVCSMTSFLQTFIMVSVHYALLERQAVYYCT